MKVRELRTILSKYPDDMDIYYENPNCGGRGEDFLESDIIYDHTPTEHGGSQLLISCPFWKEVD